MGKDGTGLEYVGIGRNRWDRLGKMGIGGTVWDSLETGGVDWGTGWANWDM